jgi:chromate reductase
MTKLLFLAGSARKTSLNKRLAQCAMNLAQSKGAEVTFLDLAHYDMPLYCQDIEQEHGIPGNVIAVKKLFQDHDGIFIASPEFNSSLTPLLKNTLDWISRAHEDGEPRLSAYTGKTFALGALSPGALGGIRGLTPLRMMLGTLGCHIIPTQIAVGGQNTLNDENNLTNDVHIKMMDALVNELIHVTNALHA